MPRDDRSTPNTGHPIADGPRPQRRRADLAAGRLPDLADLEADVAALEREGAALRAALAQGPGYTVAAADVTERDVLDALTVAHDAQVYRAAIARDGLGVVAARELRDLIAAGHLIATEDDAQAEDDDLTARDDFADPRVLIITTDDVAAHLAGLGGAEPEPRRLFDPTDGPA